VATGEYYRASAANHQQLALSWRFQCVVQAAGAGGTASATSPPALLDPALDELLNPRFGNFRIRGIDVFQVVQPNAGARMWDYPDSSAFGVPKPAPFPVACGGGTPTSWLKINGLCALGAEPALSTHYAGVKLDRRKPTTAVVYVDMDGAPAASPGQPLVVTLRLRLDGKPYDVPLQQTIPAPPPSSMPYPTAAERANPALGVQFQAAPHLAVLHRQQARRPPRERRLREGLRTATAPVRRRLHQRRPLHALGPPTRHRAVDQGGERRAAQGRRQLERVARHAAAESRTGLPRRPGLVRLQIRSVHQHQRHRRRRGPSEVQVPAIRSAKRTQQSGDAPLARDWIVSFPRASASR
jgi:hypothetical protein